MIMSLTVQQLLTDAKRLSTRLRDHDQTADTLISRAQEVLKQVDAMRQYQEDVDNLNEVAHNRPRAHLVLGIQQENRHIRTLQQENKELRAALEEHQNALELIMSKYRHHVTKLVNTTKPDLSTPPTDLRLITERTEKVCEMAAVMKEAVRMDEDSSNQQQEMMARLITENKGLREILDISQKNNSTQKVKKIVSNVHKEVQTEESVSERPGLVEQEVTVTLPMPPQPKPPPRSPKLASAGVKVPFPVEKSDARKSVEVSVAEGTVMSDGESDETGSEDESIKYDTIKKSDLRKNKAQDVNETAVNKTVVENVSKNDAVDVEKDASKSPENHIPSLASPILEVEDSKSVISSEKKLSPSEEVVCNLVDQIVSDSVSKETDVTISKESIPCNDNEQNSASKNDENSQSKGRGKGKKQNKSSPKKTGKKGS